MHAQTAEIIIRPGRNLSGMPVHVKLTTYAELAASGTNTKNAKRRAPGNGREDDISGISLSIADRDMESGHAAEVLYCRSAIL